MLRHIPTFEVRCDFGAKSTNPGGQCGETARVEARNATSAVRSLRRAGWTISRTTDDWLLRYVFKPCAYTDQEWQAMGIRSGWAARCPEHANTRFASAER